MSDCSYLFCGCHTIISSYERIVKVNDLGLILAIAFIMVIIMLSFRASIEWFIYKDYYPLKQKSPILNFLLIGVIALQLLFYPGLYTFNYLTNLYSDPDVRLYFRATLIALDFMVYSIYFLRCLRIFYVHRVHSSRRKTFVFRLFKRQVMLAIISVIFSVFRALPVILDNSQNSEAHFRLQIEFSINTRDYYYSQQPFLIHILLTSFLWQCLLIYCLYLQRHINKIYDMKHQLILVIITQLIMSFLFMIIIAKNPDQQSILLTMCYKFQYYPLSELIRSVKLVIVWIISIFLPLRRKKIYHRLLPSGRNYKFSKTMRDFLMENQFRNIFEKFLRHLDEENGVTYNFALIDLWKKMIVLRYNSDKTLEQKIHILNTVIKDAQSIVQLQNSENILELTIPTQKTSTLEQDELQAYTQKIQKLEQFLLKKLDKIYINQYTLTKSYLFLRKLTKNNKNININMIMLNMALIVDTVTILE